MYYKRDICIYIIRILFIQYNININQNCEDYEKIPKKYEGTSKVLLK